MGLCKLARFHALKTSWCPDPCLLHPTCFPQVEYRVWNPFRSKLAASILAGVDNIHVKPGSKLLYLGAASGTSVSHCSDLVGPEGAVYAVEFSHRCGGPGSAPCWTPLAMGVALRCAGGAGSICPGGPATGLLAAGFFRQT